MQVIFIHHSCFLVEVDDLVLIFDYFGAFRISRHKRLPYILHLRFRLRLCFLLLSFYIPGV